MWKSFLMSIGLLAFAMILALYSSSAAHDGRVPAAAVSALGALGIALGVGVKFVPRLASHVDWDWLPFLSHYHVTREGWIYFGAITVVVFAAINTANNLLYMVLSALLAVLAFSGFLSALNFRFVRIVVRTPPHCYAGEPFPVAIEVHNEKRVFPAFSLRVAAPEDSALRFSHFYVTVVSARQSIAHTSQALISKRGRYQLRGVKVSSRYPFGFFRKDRKHPAEAECICYPEILPEEQVQISSIDLRGTNSRFERGVGHDLYTIRNYVPSDSARHVHWKASAKTATLKTREYAAEETRRVTLTFDRFGHPDDVEKFEQLISYAASVVYHLIHAGVEVKFVSDGWQGRSLEPILEYLAVVEMTGSTAPPAAEEASMRFSLRS
jgi:uncharacterized protein (DUF58 family)